MKTVAQITFAERLGRTLGRAWRGCVRLDRRATGWLIEQGWAPRFAKATLLIIELAAFGILLYKAFWLALVFVFAVGAAWGTRNADWDDAVNKPEWREGHGGFGLYDKNEWRHDMGDPDQS